MADEDVLTPEEISAAKDIFEGRDKGRSGCVHCTGIHDQVRGLAPARQPCPRVKSAEWHPDGTILRVEYWPHSEWLDPDKIIFPSDVYGFDDIEQES